MEITVYPDTQKMHRKLHIRHREIEKAKEKQLEIQRLSAEHESMLAEQKKTFLKEQKAKADMEIEKIQADSKKSVDSARTVRLNTYETYREECAKEYSRILSNAEKSTEQIAEIFAERLINQPRVK